MANVDDLKDILKLALRDQPRRKEHVSRFQTLVWESDRLDVSKKVEVMMRDLAYDLDYYQPDEAVPGEDSSFYGDSRLEQEIRAVLARMSKD